MIDLIIMKQKYIKTNVISFVENQIKMYSQKKFDVM